MDKPMKRVKQLLEHGQYPVDDNKSRVVCPDCGKSASLWDMSNAHVRGTPIREYILVCDKCYFKRDRYDMRSVTIDHIWHHDHVIDVKEDS